MINLIYGESPLLLATISTSTLLAKHLMSNLSTTYAVASPPAIGTWGIVFSLMGGILVALLEKYYIEDLRVYEYEYETRVSFMRRRITGVLVASGLAVGINSLLFVH